MNPPLTCVDWTLQYYVFLLSVLLKKPLFLMNPNFNSDSELAFEMAAMVRLWLLLEFLSLLILPSSTCPDDQKQSLLQFKSTLLNHTNTISILGSWNSTSDCCFWDRVVCKSDRYHPRSSTRPVVALYLDSLVPLLPTETLVVSSTVLIPIFRIKTLMLLDISSNHIQGEFPGHDLASLSKLVHLDMMQNKFSGNIPSQIFHLRYLQYLDLSGNLLSGGLSHQVGFLSDLRTLKLDENLLGGNIPEEIWNLTKLQELSLSSNGFSGRIPPSVKNLRQLQVLDLRENLLSEQIPTEIGSLSNLSTVALSKNKITGGIPRSLQNLSKLETLRLDNNLLTGEIPSWLFDINPLNILFLGGKGNRLTWNNSSKTVPKCMLSQLSLQSCGLAGEIPLWISAQKALVYLDLSYNKLRGTFPLWLAEMDLGTIILSDNKLIGAVPHRLFQSLSLSVLDLSRNNFSGELPENIGDATEIMVLMLAGNNFSGTIPRSISDIYRLLLLDLSNNRFSGDTFPVFAPDAFLAYVDFSNNEFSGHIPVTFSKETRILSLGKNKFSGTLPRNLTNLVKLEHLDVHDNTIEGEFPKFITEMSGLQILNLRNTSLQGPIPSSVSMLRNLQILDLSSNNFTGNIPPEFGNLVGIIDTPTTFSSISAVFTFSIKYVDLIVNWKRSVQGLSSNPSIDIYSLLDLSKNQLSGEIPASLGNLKGLKTLNVSSNSLSGKIPSSLGRLKSVESLDLSHNNLSGKIPQSFEKLQQLTILDVSNNHLEGPIPIGGQMDTMNYPNYFANNSGLCGPQIGLPCPAEESPPTSEDTETKESRFAWEGAWIGFPVGFCLSVMVIFLTGCFPARALSPARSSRQRKHTPSRISVR